MNWRRVLAQVERTEEEQDRINMLYAIYCAESVLPIYENKHPNNNGPRLAIEAAKTVLKYPTEENKAKAKAAAWAADDAARDNTTFDDANAAWNAARNNVTLAAAYAAYSAAFTAIAQDPVDAGYVNNAIFNAEEAAKRANISIDFNSLETKAQQDIQQYSNNTNIAKLNLI